MPYMDRVTLPVWVLQCERRFVTGKEMITSNAESNCIIQITAGKCMAISDGESSVQNTRNVMFLGRNTAVTLQVEIDETCQVTILRFGPTKTGSQMDLNHVCMEIPLVDAFFSKKARYCTLEDRQFIYVTLGELWYEWEHALPERETVISQALKILFVKLSRSFHTHHRFSGIAYLTAAKKYMVQNFQQELSVQSIADHVGISRSYLEALFARYDRNSIVDYLHVVRCDRAAFLLSTTRFPIIDIAIDCGFNNRQHFARVFGKIYGMPPKCYRQDGLF